MHNLANAKNELDEKFSSSVDVFSKGDVSMPRGENSIYTTMMSGMTPHGDSKISNQEPAHIRVAINFSL